MSKPALHFGKYAGTPIEDYTNDMVNYLRWIRGNDDIWRKLNERTKQAILNRIS